MAEKTIISGESTWRMRLSRRHAAAAPSRVPSTKAISVVVTISPIVQGIAAPIRVETLTGYCVID